MADATVTFDLLDVLGVPFDARRTKVWVEFNTEDGWVIDENGDVRMDAGTATVTDAGLVTITGIPIPGVTTNPTDWQIKVHFDVPMVLPGVRSTTRKRGDFGWMTVTADADLSDLIAEQYVPPTWLTYAQALLQTYVDQGADLLAAQIALSGIDSTDSAVSAIIANSLLGPLTQQSLGVLVAQTGDQTSRINSFLSTPSPLGIKRLVGTFSVSDVLAIPANTYIDAHAATITSTDASKSVFSLAAGAQLVGGVINSPATWDGTTGGVWSMATVYITGSGAVVEDVTFNNVPHRGVGVKDTDDATVRGCKFFGNYPAASWTGTETSHFAIAVDPGGTGDGSIIVADNFIKSCVQGVFVGNFGTGDGANVTIDTNVFVGLWNHGVYTRTGDGYVVSGNTFRRCQKAITVTGNGHSVTGNAVYTSLSGDARDEAGIHIRDAIGCTVSGNTINGDSTSDNIGISLDNPNVDTEISRNVVTGNTLTLAATASAHCAIRVGNSSATTVLQDNRIEGNVIKAPGLNSSGGVIQVITKIGSYGVGNIVQDNTIVGTGDSHTVVLTRQKYARVIGNEIRNEFNAPSATSITMIRLDDTYDSEVYNNLLVNQSTFGTNIALSGVVEVNGSDRNVLGPNTFKLNTTLLTSATETTQIGSASVANANLKPPQVDVFTASGTWTKPGGAVRHDVIVIAGAGGGGSGRRGPDGAVRCGGGGGSGGQRAFGSFAAGDLGNTETVTVGTGGAGGAAQTTDGTDGNAGTAGGLSAFGASGNRWLVANGGSGGSGGTATNGTGGAAATPGSSTGASASTTGAAGGSASSGTGRGTPLTGGAGGAGGGITSANAESAGGAGSLGASGATSGAPTGGTTTGGAGGAGLAPKANSRMPGTGGAGGGASRTTAAGAGGDGAAPGGAGGGGGASLNGVASGAGGAGKDGAVYVITYFS